MLENVLKLAINVVGKSGAAERIVKFIVVSDMNWPRRNGLYCVNQMVYWKCHI